MELFSKNVKVFGRCADHAHCQIDDQLLSSKRLVRLLISHIRHDGGKHYERL